MSTNEFCWSTFYIILRSSPVDTFPGEFFIRVYSDVYFHSNSYEGCQFMRIPITGLGILFLVVLGISCEMQSTHTDVRWTTFLIFSQLTGIWSYWQFFVWLWTKRNPIWFIKKRKHVSAIIFLSIWEVTKTYFIESGIVSNVMANNVKNCSIFNLIWQLFWKKLRLLELENYFMNY